jgi:hypothetical protein
MRRSAPLPDIGSFRNKLLGPNKSTNQKHSDWNYQVIGVSVVTGQRHHDDFDQLGTSGLFEEEIGRQQLAVARDANEIARAASYAASDAAAAARLQARISIAALIIAAAALVVSVMTPSRIASYMGAQSWVSRAPQ